MAKTQVEGKVVAVTGAARGIGREIAHALAGAGAKVSLGDLDHEEVLQAAAQLPGALGLGLDLQDLLIDQQVKIHNVQIR